MTILAIGQGIDMANYWIENTPGLRFVSAACLRYPRRSSLERLVAQARSRHYSTFSLYDPDAFEEALAVFRDRIESRFAGPVEWHDENILIQAVRDDDLGVASNPEARA